MVKNHPYMGTFPIATWEMAVGTAKKFIELEKEVRLMVLVNDWQWVKPAEPGQPNFLREEFYEKRNLPKSYVKTLQENNVDENILLPFKNKDGEVLNRFFFSETSLRNSYASAHGAKCNLDNHCAQEYLPLLNRLQKEGAELLISFVPKTCQIPINDASKEAKKVYGMNNLTVVNVYSHGIFKNDFWEDVEVSVFK
jgi:hypothetical protein